MISNVTPMGFIDALNRFYINVIPSGLELVYPNELSLSERALFQLSVSQFHIYFEIVCIPMPSLKISLGIILNTNSIIPKGWHCDRNDYPN